MPVDALSLHPGSMSSTTGRRGDIAARLLAHYDRTARDLPWRARPGSNGADPYRVWLSEIMLQQTTVAAVTPYFRTFTSRWPTVEALAAADEAEVMAAWAGLGYYARARNLIACARAVAHQHGGAFPDTEEDLRALPGIGAYTAAAVSAIAFGRRAVAVDANVERVVARLFAIEEALPAARGAIRAAADSITPDTRSGDFAQAMMDLGSSICTARTPRCMACPLMDACAGFAAGEPARFPVKLAKAAKSRRVGSAWWIERRGAVWLVRRPARGLLGGMRALPTSDWVLETGRVVPFEADWRWLARPVAHVFTHFALDLSVAVAAVDGEPPAGMGAEGGWWPIDTLEDAGLPTLFARAARAVLKERAG